MAVTKTVELAPDVRDASDPRWGVYRRVGADQARLARYTAYVAYPDDPAAGALDADALAELVRSGHAGIEEIDVDAVSERDAHEIAAAALARDYEPNGTIVEIVGPRAGLYL